MNILILMIPMAMLLGIGFVVAFLWANNQGQFDDLETPAHRILFDENERKKS
ncbi:MAG: cbb3-type cytochrome oxidase assembly protein CcoS [Bdellovibrio sp.]|nr:cbb3-type cytochrome oxidase assembly protein CcoS [Bdellovibrio sp.]